MDLDFETFIGNVLLIWKRLGVKKKKNVTDFTLNQTIYVNIIYI